MLPEPNAKGFGRSIAGGRSWEHQSTGDADAPGCEAAFAYEWAVIEAGSKAGVHAIASWSHLPQPTGGVVMTVMTHCEQRSEGAFGPAFRSRCFRVRPRTLSKSWT